LPNGAKVGVKKRVGLVVAFAALGEAERQSVVTAWDCAAKLAGYWTPEFLALGLDPISARAADVDVLVYLGESSRFDGVVGEASRELPIVLVKSTVDELLKHAAGTPPRYRMCAGISGISRALASTAPDAPTLDWKAIPWPSSVASLTLLEKAEQSYVNISVESFREAAEDRGRPWQTSLPDHGGAFSVFLTMHDPAAAILAHTALTLWPQCTVLAADGMVSERAPDGQNWPARLVRVRHWSPQIKSASNLNFRKAMGRTPLSDFDSAGMVFGTMHFLDRAFSGGADPSGLHLAGRHTGPLGLMQFTASGRPYPETLVILRGGQLKIVANKDVPR